MFARLHGTAVEGVQLARSEPPEVVERQAEIYQCNGPVMEPPVFTGQAVGGSTGGRSGSADGKEPS